jgi:hypothetical protein
MPFGADNAQTTGGNYLAMTQLSGIPYFLNLAG